MSEEPTGPPADVPGGAPLWLVLVLVVLAGAWFDLFCILLLPVRLAGHLVPAGPVLVLAVNAVLSTVTTRAAADRLPAQVLLAVSIAVSALAAVRGPGGDLLVTRDLQGMYLLFVVTACVGAAVPLFRRTRTQ